MHHFNNNTDSNNHTQLPWQPGWTRDCKKLLSTGQTSNWPIQQQLLQLAGTHIPTCTVLSGMLQPQMHTHLDSPVRELKPKLHGAWLQIALPPLLEPVLQHVPNHNDGDIHP